MKRFFSILSLLIAILLMSSSLNVEAQSGKLNKANRYFEEFNYPKAADLYKKILAKGDNSDAIKKLAECYRLMNEPIEAEYWYEQVVNMPESTEEDLLHYGMSLKANGKCSLARDVFLDYAQQVPADTRGLRLVESCDKEEYFMQDPGVYSIDELSINSIESDFGPAFYEDGIVFASARGGRYQDRTYTWTEAPYLDLFYSEGDVGGGDMSSLSDPKLFKGQTNTWLHEGTVTFSRDQNTIFFTRNNFINGKKGSDRNNTIRLKIYTAEREGDSWGKAEELPFNSDEYSVGHPTLSVDGEELYFVSDMPGGYGEEDIYVVYREGSSWGSPINLGPEINTEGREMFPYIHDDGNLYFASDALPGLGGLDIFSSFQTDVGNWTAPENLRTPINTNHDDFGMIITPDGDGGYFASNRPSGRGDDDIYGFSRTTFVVNGVVVDADTQEPIEGAIVQLIEDGEIVQERVTYGNGEFNFPISPGKDYEIKTFKPNYTNGDLEVSTIGLNTPEVEVKIAMEPENGESAIKCELRGLVYEEKGGATVPVVGALVKLLSNADDQTEQSYTTGDDGTYVFEIDPETDYAIFANKEFYFTATKQVSTKGRDCASPLMKDLALDILLELIEVDNSTTNRGTGNNGGGNNDNGTYNGGTTGGGTNNNGTYNGGSTGGGTNYSNEFVDSEGNTYKGEQVVQQEDGTYTTEDGTVVTRTYPSGGSTGGIPKSVLSLNHIYYDLDKAYIRPDAAIELDKVVAFMALNPGVTIELGSHTDSRSSDSYNMDLSQRRATSAVDYIVRKGVSEDRILAVGYGETRLTNRCSNGVRCPESDHSANRRTEFRVVGYSSNAFESVPRYYGGSKEYYDGGNDYPNNDYNNYDDNSGSISEPYTKKVDVTKRGGATSKTPTYVGSANSDDIYDNDNPTYFDSDETVFSDAGEQVSAVKFKIQLGAFKNVNLDRFSSLRDLGFIEVEQAGNVQKVVLGEFSERDFAVNILEQIRNRGFGDAFLVTYYKGDRQ